MKDNILNFTAESAVPAFRFVVAGSSEGSVKPAAAGADALGVSSDMEASAGGSCDVQLDGVTQIELGGTVAFGGKIASDATGKGVACVSGNYSAVALDSGVTGDLIRIKIVSGTVAGN